MGVEPTCSAWEADILPMNYIRIITIEHMCRPTRYILYYTIPQLINQVFFIVRLKFFVGLSMMCYKNQKTSPKDKKEYK